MAKACAFIGALLALGTLSPSVRATPAPVSTWVPNGPVHALETGPGGVTYLGGSFSRLAPATGGSASVRRAGATVDADWPKVAGEVRAVIPDGSGGHYLRGAFQTVDGAPRSNLAHVDSGGSLTGWNPSANNAVNALALAPDGTVYAGGAFTEAGGASRERLVALASDGLATGWTVPVNDVVRTIAVDDGAVIVGGLLTALGGVERSNLAAIGPDGLPTSWGPRASGTVRALERDADGTIYVGGTSLRWAGSLARGWPRSTRAGPSPAGARPRTRPSTRSRRATGHSTPRGPSPRSTDSRGRASRRSRSAAQRPDGLLMRTERCALVPRAGGGVYAGGDFSAVGGSARSRLVAVDESGAVASWDPAANGVVQSLAFDGEVLYVAGAFTQIGDRARSRLAAIDLTSGLATGWAPAANSTVYAIASLAGADLLAGGQFASVDGTSRSRLTAVGSDGVLGRWDPSPGGTVNAISVRPSGSVEVGGAFANVGTVVAAGFARFPAEFAASSSTRLSPASGVRAGTEGAAVPPTFTAPAVDMRYRRQRCAPAGGECLPIGGAEAATRTPSADDVGARLTVEVTGVDEFGQQVSSTSAESDVVAPSNVDRPEIVGVPRVGENVELRAGTWLGRGLRWTLDVRRCRSTCETVATVYRDGDDAAATASHRVMPADAGARLQLRAAASRNGSAVTTATSEPTAPVADDATTGDGRPSPADELAAPPSGWSRPQVCAPTRPGAHRSAKRRATVRLTSRQLRVNQRIAQAAVRRADAIERWLAAGIEGRDICGGSLGVEELAADVSFRSTAPRVAPTARPRPIVVREARSGRAREITLGVRQLRVNQRIARAALRRADVLAERFDGGLIAADVKPGSIDRGRLVPGIAPVARAARRPSATTSIRVDRGRPRTEPKTRFTLTRSQMRTNQRVSQAAIRRLDALAARIRGGLRGTEFRDGSLTARSLAIPVTGTP